jgi:O-antigen ligase
MKVFVAYWLFLMAWLPMPLGSNRPWSWWLMIILVCGGLGLFLLISRQVRRCAADAFDQHRVLFILFGIWLGYLCLQWLSVPLDLLELVAPYNADIYRQTQVFTSDRAHSIALDRRLAFDEGLKYLSYILIMFAFSMLSGNRRRLLLIAILWVFIGLLESVYGLTVYLTRGQLDLWAPHWLGHDVLTGTFVNRNSYAAHLVNTFSMGLGLLFLLFTHGSHHRVLPLKRALGHLTTPKGGLLVLALLIIALALVFSQSRGGLLSIIAALVIMSIVALRVRRRGKTEIKVAIVGIVAVVLGIGIFQPGWLLTRLLEVEQSASGRIELWLMSLDLLAASPWVGFGSGAYPTVITSFRPEGVLTAIGLNRAHNDYLELLTDQGFIGAFLLALPVLFTLWKLIVAYRECRDSLTCGLLFGVLLGVFAFLIHAFVDFNFRIPANAAYFYAILGIGLAASQMPEPEDRRHRSTSRRRRRESMSPSLVHQDKVAEEDSREAVEQPIAWRVKPLRETADDGKNHR